MARRVANRVWSGALALVLAGCSAAAAPEAEKPAEPAPVPVSLATAAAPGPGRILLTGTVRFEQEIDLAFVQPGRVERILADIGDQVAAGALLATQEPGPVDAGAVAAREDARRARLELDRVKTLAAQGWVTKARLEAAEAEAAATAARLASSRFEARYARITAPAAGIVLARGAEPGAIVAAGTPVLALGDLSAGYVLQVPLTDAQAAAIRVGAAAAVRFDALGLPPIAGRVSEIGGRGDPRTGTFLAEIRLPAAPGIRSGLIGSAEIAAPGAGPAPLIVPATAVFAARAGEGFVYVYDPKARRVRARLIGLGPVGDGGIAVTSGLRPGERIVRTGLDRLRDGARVTVAG